MNTPASSRGGRAGLKTTARGLDRGDLRVQVRVRHELAAAWRTSIHCYGDLLARARHPSTPSRPRVCRTPCSQGITRDPCPGSLRSAQEDVWCTHGPPPVNPTTRESRTVRESADADLQRDVDPPAGRPMGDPEPELRREVLRSWV